MVRAAGSLREEGTAVSRDSFGVYESGLERASDKALRKSLHSLASTSSDFWDFSETVRRSHAHGYFQYPAMMVPNMVGRALDEIARARHGRMHLLDPFAGSGTVLTEAIARGWDTTALDINPLSVLLCRTKAGPFKPKLTSDGLQRVVDGARSEDLAQSRWFPNINKWFEPLVRRDLDRLSAQIVSLDDRTVRRFLWVVLAETVRLTSNSRLSTVKLHVKAESDRVASDAIDVFSRVGHRNLGLLRSELQTLRGAGVLLGQRPISRVNVELVDSKVLDLTALHSKPNLLVTSPPYGDNHTTITYGQHSYLPLQWIDGNDIQRGIDPDTYNRPTAIDYASLGGRRLLAIDRHQAVASKSPAAREIVADLLGERRDHANRVAAFFADLDASLTRSMNSLASGAHVVVTVGDRTVHGRSMPTTRVIQDIASDLGAVTIAAIPRTLPISRNRFATRMSTEYLLVMRMPS